MRHLFFAFTIAIANSAYAQSAASGLEQYRQWCAVCHGLPPNSRQAGTEVVNADAIRIREAINTIGTMNFLSFLTDPQIRDIASYFAESRGASTAPRIVNVRNFRNRNLNSCFMARDELEIAGILQGAAGEGWELTKDDFQAYDVNAFPSTAQRVYRFYGRPFNRHFYTAFSSEGESLINLERQTPSDQPRWVYEGLSFAIEVPALLSSSLPIDERAVCPSTSPVPIYRAYNNGHRFNPPAPNHCYTPDRQRYEALKSQGWEGEGIAMCATALASPLR